MTKIHSKSLPDIDRKTAVNIVLQNQLFLIYDKTPLKKYIHKIISKLGYIQIDTISVTERSVNHIIWSRAGKFDKNIISELFSEKKIFEYWSHAAAILPMNDYRYSLIFKRSYLERYGTFKNKNRQFLKYVIDRITSEGPLMSRDFEGVKKGTSGWWNRKPAKEALEFLFFSGDLMVKERIGFQKVYELTERVLPSDVDDSFPTDAEYCKYLIISSINANGIITEKEMTYLKRYDKKKFQKVLNELKEESTICEITVKGIEDQNYYTFPEKLNNVKYQTSDLNILSPFDNLIIQRKRIKTLFDFDYQVECYVPQSKRKYGYFSHPVLYKNNFIGRIDMKADRKNRILIINKFYPEEKIKLSRLSLNIFNSVLQDYAEFTGCEKVNGILI